MNREKKGGAGERGPRLADRKNCTGCGACAGVCRMQVDPVRDPDSPECIRCGECMKACPMHALSFSIIGKHKRQSEDEKS